MFRCKLTELVLKKVSKEDIEFLYKLLKHRSRSHNISHKKMPSLREHIKFVNSKPYKKWYVILNDKQKIGSIYISKNDEVAIHLKNNICKEKFFILALKQLIKFDSNEFFYFNTNPNNKGLNNFFKKNNFTLLQLTYKISKIEIDEKW